MFQLPNEIIKLIYEYDDTYKKKYRKVVSELKLFLKKKEVNKKKILDCSNEKLDKLYKSIYKLVLIELMYIDTMDHTQLYLLWCIMNFDYNTAVSYSFVV